MIGCLLDQLKEQFIHQAVLLHGLVKHSLDEEDMVFLFFVGVDLLCKRGRIIVLNDRA